MSWMRSVDPIQQADPSPQFPDKSRPLHVPDADFHAGGSQAHRFSVNRVQSGCYERKTDRPGNSASEPSSSSMRSSWLYLATRSLRAGAPVLI